MNRYFFVALAKYQGCVCIRIILHCEHFPLQNFSSKLTSFCFYRFTVKNEDRGLIHNRIKMELAGANSCHIRMLYLRLCEMAIALFSKEYFKQNFFSDLVCLSADVVANVRLKLCTMMPRLKSLLSLPSDKSLLQVLLN